MNQLKKWLSCLLVCCMVIAMLPVTAFAQKHMHDAVITLDDEIWEMPELQTTGYEITSFALNSNGKPTLKSTNEVNWIDRLADLPDYAMDFYDWLVENSDGDGTNDALIDPTMGTAHNGDYVHPVVAFVDVPLSFTYPSGASDDEIGNAASEALSAILSENMSYVSEYLLAAYSAFDRDHPEVFWLSGATQYGNAASYSYSTNGDGTGLITYTQVITFYLKNTSDFDIRNAEYSSVATITSAISTRDSAVNSIIAGATGNRQAKIQYLNDWLTKSNCYNTTTNLVDISHDCNECISALEGNTGTAGPICEGYARAFKVLCDALDIPCVLVNGSSDSKKAHMWNYVQMDDGKWYAVDCTWNDPSVSGVTGAVSGYENENYLLIGSSTTIDGKAFVDSHLVTNIVTDGGVAFTNGPVLATRRYQVDTDGDGLPDEWEINGADIDGDGLVDIHIEQMGADPNIPDIFVEIDWMYRQQEIGNFLWWEIEKQSEIDYSPSIEALRMVYQQFKNHGYNLHLDAGPNSMDFVTGKMWGNLSQGNAIAYKSSVDVNDWNRIINDNFIAERFVVFRYCVFVNKINNDTITGQACDIPGQFFLVADVDGYLFGLGNMAIAGTFMHELGHTLGLVHGGITSTGEKDYSTNYKPNYFSIMNYSFQISGLLGVSGTDALNYSEYVLPAIDEAGIIEDYGVDPHNNTVNSGLGTKWFKKGLFGYNDYYAYNIAGSSIDFDQNGKIDLVTTLDVNRDGSDTTILTDVVRDWDHINIKGDFVGDYGASFDVTIEELTKNEIDELTFDEAVEYNVLGNPGACEITSITPGVLYTDIPHQKIVVLIRNLNCVATNPTLKVSSETIAESYEATLEISASENSNSIYTVEIPVKDNIEVGSYSITCELLCENAEIKMLNSNVVVKDPVVVEIERGDTKDLIPDDEIKKMSIEWESSNADVVVVEKGIVTANTLGDAYIYGYIEDADTVVCLISVVEPEHIHIYNNPSFIWSERNKCTATFSCIDGDDTQTVACTVTCETTPATETEAGKTVYTATVEFSGQIYTDTKIETMPATGHIPGDINGDGKVNNRDAARLMQYLAGWEVEYVKAALDVNGDGKVSNRDAARLMQYLAGWDVEIN